MPNTDSLPRPVSQLLDAAPLYTRHMRPSELQASQQEMAETLNSDKVQLRFAEHTDANGRAFNVAVLESIEPKDETGSEGATLAIKLSYMTMK